MYVNRSEPSKAYMQFQNYDGDCRAQRVAHDVLGEALKGGTKMEMEMKQTMRPK